LNNKIKRLQTSVKADSKLALRFAEWLGLKQEGLMKNYGPDGSDYYRYARIF
jgi:RimJ/RimL family protein N-acetyltransferase